MRVKTSKAAEKARKMMDERKGHCVQAVLTSLGERASSGGVDNDTTMKVTSVFRSDITHQLL